ncbi:MAG TPA: hypothetical protein VIK35_12700 [Verrucomicrobiae bacterium]
MRDRSEQILRISCLTLAALVVLQLVYAGFQVNPLAGVKIPDVPALETNPFASSASVPVTKMGTSGQTNPPTLTSKETNSIATNVMTPVETNSLAAQTNQALSSNPATIVKIEMTNSSDVAPAKIQTPASVNAAAETSAETNLVSTNASAQMAANNSLAAGTNPAVMGAAKISGNNLIPAMAMAGGMGTSGVPMMPEMPGNAPKLPPEIQARVDQIVNSEIFAPIMHPMPMGLLGIAGETAFLRTATGQTGLVKTGDSLGDLKLLKIGINRVLVEQDGKEQELTIFNGYGGDSLLSNQDKTTK